MANLGRTAFRVAAVASLKLIFTLPVTAEESRILSIALTVPETTDLGAAYEHSFRLARSAGMKTPGEITFYWDEVEKRSLLGGISYSMPFLETLKSHLSSSGMRPVITLCPVETMESRVPSDLRDLPFDHPKLRERFAGLIRWVHGELDGLEPHAIVFGNEFDLFLNHDSERWRQFRVFHESALAVVRSLEGWQEVPVALEPTFANLTGPDWEVLREMNQRSDIIGVSYYAIKDGRAEDLSAIGRDLDLLERIYPGRRFDFYQYGYPSSDYLGSSEEKQRAFVAETFEEWDRRKPTIRLITFTWLYDLDVSQIVENARRTTGKAPDKSFTEFLGTLGLLRRTEGDAKPAFIELRKQAAKRGWTR